MIFYEDRDPVGPYQVTVAPGRSRHLRFNNFEHPEKIKPGTPFSAKTLNE